jgi:hypothetical protein
MSVAPAISVVTAARNMERFAAETIRSVIAQKQAGDEYLFIDGASTDATLAIARGFGQAIDVLVSEPDAGQYHAIAKGMARARGEILCWINADDILMPWTFAVVREIFARFPEIDWIIGTPAYLSASGQLTRIQSKLPAYPRRFIANGWYRRALGGYLQQESMFWRRRLWERAGGLDLRWRLAADFELWTRFAEHADLVAVDVPLAAFRERPGEQRSSAQAAAYDAEVEAICRQKPAPPLPWRWLARRGVVARSLCRGLISCHGAALVHDRGRGGWRKLARRRSLARVGWGRLADEWLAARGVS